ncbi:uncharacterized protein QC763_511710 [Podospora pseudopauciseta]|uniref:HEPN domain-containing protein n=2 Tax=Podospora TaxID=5144 RepID=A0ABY6SDB5_PODCO|nr:hypothetical protein QC763_511710 [Podospora pseudopauciseta]VBB81413.1 Putative protein of unknown function [Podospora comata]
MAWARILWQVYLRVEDHIVARILQSPGFHHGVRRIHRRVEDFRYGRNPHEPLRQGEASADPREGYEQARSFFKYFIDELKNQAKGRPTDVAPPPAPPKK